MQPSASLSYMHCQFQKLHKNLSAKEIEDRSETFLITGLSTEEAVSIISVGKIKWGIPA